ncbi:MAG TPA: cytochrome c biogenesis protein CcdA [Xanthobacteraceae bacterium]|jgi:cytochrome c biogenesis protein CcdA
MLATLGLAYLAGALSTLSPCVLPLLPVILGAAASAHPLGPLALGLGLASSFVLVGLFVATIGFAIGLDADVLRLVAAVLMIIVGGVLIVPLWQARLAHAAGPVTRWADQQLTGLAGSGLTGQLGVGLLLGLAWSPCVGPTLGAASLLASQATDLPRVAVTMLLFGLGAASPLLVVGILSREVLFKARDRMLAAGQGLKAALGIGFVLVGASIVTGLDKQIETALVDLSPQWLTELTTRY